jgi:cytochrome c
MSKSPEFPTILLVTGWATAASIAALLSFTTGKTPEPAPIVIAQATTQPAPAEPAAEPAPAAPASEPTASATAAATTTPLGLGRPALPEEIAAWDMTVLPDGTGLPEGSGDVLTGEEVFAENCASCHGEFAEGLDSWPVLAGGDGSLTDPRPVKTIGSYWPYLSTVYDYVHRSMPFGQAQTLSVDDTYAITAFLLYSNGLVEDDFTLTHENFTTIALPNAGGFYPDDRAQSEYPLFSAEPCMADCRAAPPEVTKRAVDLNVTPKDEDGKPAGTLPPLNLASATGATDSAPAETAIAEAAAAEPPEAAAAEEPVEAAAAEQPTEAPETEAEDHATADPALVEAGEKVFRKCASCHKVGQGAKNGVGPALNGIVGQTIASAADFKYSKPLAELGAGGGVWDAATLHAFLENPKGFAAGTKMSFVGLKKPEERDAVIAYLSTLDD